MNQKRLINIAAIIVLLMVIAGGAVYYLIKKQASAPVGQQQIIRIEIAPIYVLSPNGGEVWKIGDENTISYKGGKGDISAMLFDKNNDTMGGWIFTSGISNGVVKWDTKTVYLSRSPYGTKIIQPGEYKIRIMDDYGNAGTSDTWFSIVAADETVNWKTYTDEKRTFEFKYPKGFEIMHFGTDLEGYTNIFVGIPRGNPESSFEKELGINISYRVFEASEYHLYPININFSDCSLSYETTRSLKPITIGGINGCSEDWPPDIYGRPKKLIYLNPKDEFLLFFYSLSRPDERINQVLSTFKFTR